MRTPEQCPSMGLDRAGIRGRPCLLAAWVILWSAANAWGAMASVDIPSDAPNDAVMASAAEVQEVTDWARLVFTGEPSPSWRTAVPIEVRRQDFSELHFGLSCMDTPIRIGQQKFDRGLGTHANSEIVVGVPAGAKQFKAFVGIDNNYDTQGKHGSAVFSVEVDGLEALRTCVLHGGGEPYAVEVELPEGTAELVLKVDTTSDGPSHDQSDWADAHFVLDNGAAVWLDEGHRDRLLFQEEAPFSFEYGGVGSAELLKTWHRESQTTATEETVDYTVRWTDPESSLAVVAEVRCFKRYPAVDWVLRFENTGQQDTPVIAGIQPLDILLRTGNTKIPTILGRNLGDSCAELSFANVEASIEPGSETRMAPVGGRSSNGAFPFFDVRYGEETLTTAIGWSGQWEASAARADTGPTRLRAGMELTHLALHPGESIRTPRILLALGRCDVETAHNRFRRLLLFNYVPQQDGKPVQMPVALQCFDRYSWTVPEWATEKGQKKAARFAAEAGFDTLWLDAAWFPGGFPNGVGNWFPKPQEFPNGLKPVSDECHARGLRFIVWFEPERVAKDTLIAREHPEYVFGGADGGLFRLNDPEARRWLTDTLSEQIEDGGIDIYRNDFNIDPLPFWRSNDTEDRQGMTEIRYVEGLYQMWDELIERHPGLVIDNCASGGRRIDLELCMRSVPLWRSDTNCTPGHVFWNQAHSMGLGRHVPLHTSCAWTPDVYDMRSSVTTGLICQWDYMQEGFPLDEAKANLAEAKELRQYWYGDSYSLAPNVSGSGQWFAYQFHRADLNAGVVSAFRRADSNYTGLSVSLKGLDPAERYSVRLVGEDGPGDERTVAGSDLANGFELRIPRQPASLLVMYKVATP
jgi:alpha-galactosidase